MSEYGVIIDDMTWSYSRLESYLSCPYKFYLTYIAYPEPRGEEMFYASYGTFCHDLIKRYYRHEIKADELAGEYLAGYQQNVKGFRPKGSDKWMEQGLEYFRGFRPLPYEVLAVEQKYDFSVAGYQFTGIIDYLGRGEDGELYIVDNKSSDISPRSHRTKPTRKDEELDRKLRQLYLYSIPVASVYGRVPAGLCFNCFRTKVFVGNKYEPEAFSKTVKWAVRTIEEIRDAESFPPRCDYFYCHNICGYMEECCYAQEAEW